MNVPQEKFKIESTAGYRHSEVWHIQKAASEAECGEVFEQGGQGQGWRWQYK